MLGYIVPAKDVGGVLGWVWSFEGVDVYGHLMVWVWSFEGVGVVCHLRVWVWSSEVWVGS